MTTPLNDRNIILDTDSYKSSHFLQYPSGTTRLFSYLESRGGKYPRRASSACSTSSTAT